MDLAMTMLGRNILVFAFLTVSLFVYAHTDQPQTEASQTSVRPTALLSLWRRILSKPDNTGCA